MAQLRSSCPVIGVWGSGGIHFCPDGPKAPVEGEPKEWAWPVPVGVSETGPVWAALVSVKSDMLVWNVMPPTLGNRTRRFDPASQPVEAGASPRSAQCDQPGVISPV